VANGVTSGYRAVLLDALGTLVELEPPWPLLRRTLAARHGVEVSDDEAKDAMLAEMAYYRSHHQEGSDNTSLRALRRRCAGVLQEQLPQTKALELDELVDVLLDSIRFMPFLDAAPALAALRAGGHRLAIVSNWDCSLRSVLGSLGLSGAVDAIVVSAEVGALKPDPAIFDAALRALRRDARDSLFVGDSLETDVLGAQAAGLHALLLDRTSAGAATQGGRSPEPATAEVERIFSLQELVERLQAPLHA
jgi:putative hydrolase of the HAD superfamily